MSNKQTNQTIPLSEIKEGQLKALDAAKKGASTLYASDFRGFSIALLVLAELAPERLTLSQSVFFMLAASADLAGKRPTFTELRDSVGDTLNRSLHTTYRQLLEPSHQYPKAVGWLKTDTNPTDLRVKFISLTDEGRKVLTHIKKALES